MATTVVLALTTAVLACVAYFVSKFIARRRFYKNLPGPPHSMIWGHLKVIGEYTAKFPADTAFQSMVTQIKQDFDLPDIWYLDLWPAGPEFVMCSSPEAAMIPTTTIPMIQAPAVIEFFDGNLGDNFIEATNGPVWKDLHHMIAPGLTPAATKAYHKLIVEEAGTFYERLLKFSQKDEPVNMMHEIGKFPFDVVSRVFLGMKLDAQTTDCKLYEDMVRLGDVVGIAYLIRNPIAKWPFTRELNRIVARVETEIAKIARSRFAVLQQKDRPTKASATNVLDRMLLSQAEGGQSIDPRLMRYVLDKYLTHPPFHFIPTYLTTQQHQRRHSRRFRHNNRRPNRTSPPFPPSSPTSQIN